MDVQDMGCWWVKNVIMSSVAIIRVIWIFLCQFGSADSIAILPSHVMHDEILASLSVHLISCLNGSHAPGLHT